MPRPLAQRVGGLILFYNSYSYNFRCLAPSRFGWGGSVGVVAPPPARILHGAGLIFFFKIPVFPLRFAWGGLFYHIREGVVTRALALRQWNTSENGNCDTMSPSLFARPGPIQFPNNFLVLASWSIGWNIWHLSWLLSNNISKNWPFCKIWVRDSRIYIHFLATIFIPTSICGPGHVSRDWNISELSGLGLE